MEIYLQQLQCGYRLSPLYENYWNYACGNVKHLLDESFWEDYCTDSNGNKLGICAIGAPTVELLVEAYNSTLDEDDPYIECSIVDNKYYLKWSNESSYSYGIYGLNFSSQWGNFFNNWCCIAGQDGNWGYFLSYDQYHPENKQLTTFGWDGNGGCTKPVAILPASSVSVDSQGNPVFTQE